MLENSNELENSDESLIFYEPKITAYEFLKYFFANLKKLNTQEVTRDLIDFLYSQKQESQNHEIMEEITFRSNGIRYYSDSIDDALFNLQNGGLLGKMNPSFGVIIIKYTDSDLNDILKSVPSEYAAQIANLAEKYASSKSNI